MHFTKMHGTGNDFALVDTRVEEERDWAALAVPLCDRHFGVGADGLILIRETADLGYQMVMYNPDGSRAEMCGNGIRCFAKLLYEAGDIGREQVQVVTDGGRRWVRVEDNCPDDFVVAVGMGVPEFDPSRVPVDLPGAAVLDHALQIEGTEFAISAVLMGNPHAVAFVDSVDGVDLPRVGPLMEHHPAFPERINFEICQVLGPGQLRMRVWERGVGITLACGSGAAATVAAAIRTGRVAPGQLRMTVDGGELRFDWPGEGRELVMTGLAATVYDGVWRR
ncbi:MAG: diaminopimelate epimerase [Chloroflexota bacterium]|nr:diaminopimelate epimerase [Chloroflexota bacterium]MDP6508304.1 diaminopimelate epimerase [Chloroflexota bacterium]MDP6757770.1 diaminopimelate epimerase [Chloroflexota bacterium]